MSADYFRSLRLNLTPEQFHRLPRNAAYRYELIDGEVWLSPRPRWYHALLDLATFPQLQEVELPKRVSIRPLAETDWVELPAVFSSAFHRVQPFASLDKDERLNAARQALNQTRSGGDGPLIASACHVAYDEECGQIMGAILITLVPLVDLSDIDRSARWEQSPEQSQGRPHLTWIFVNALAAGHGLGTALLSATVNVLHESGYIDLASTFLEGNESSTLWHWRNGFRLLAHPGSQRELRRRWKS